jgi:two-component system chemotaxis sensor kinase CheA
MSQGKTTPKVERDPETLEIFIDESLEALQRDERLLLAAEGGDPHPDLMGVLFRDIHTIKGTSGFLSVDRVLALSHSAEDMLAKLRDGSLAPSPVIFARLLSVCDALRTMICSVRDTDDEGDIDVEPLIAEIRADLQGGAQAASPRPLSQLPAVTTAAPAASTSSAGALAAPHPVPAAPARAPSLAPSMVAQVAAPAPAEGEPQERAAEAARREAAAKGDASKGDASKGDGAKAEGADGTVRVSVAVLDRLMNLIGELVLARNQVVQGSRGGRENGSRGGRDNGAPSKAAINRLNAVTTELQEQIMKTRMQPVARMFEKIPRMVRDLCNATGKHVVSRIEGTTTEIDKALVEAIRDPLMHIVRNAIDHGIEDPSTRAAMGKSTSGTVIVRASHEGGMVLIEVEDDGRGMDPIALRAHAVKKGLMTTAEAAQIGDREALELVFRPGFSTAAKVTDISGRGVGMDVVRTHVERAGGQVEIESTVGRGSCIRLKMPLTLAIIPALLVEVAGHRFAVPQVNLLELVYLDETSAAGALENVRGAEVHRLRGEMLPIVRLDEVLRLARPVDEGRAAAQTLSIVVVAIGARRYGILVDAIHDTEEIVIKPLHGQLKRLSCYSGATVLGDGGVALILDVAGVASLSGIDLGAQRAGASPESAGEAAAQQRLLIFRAGETQCAVPLAMVARLEQVPRANVERVAGTELVQYRGGLMPLVRPESLLPLGAAAPHGHEQAVVVFDFGQMIGMAVDAILDVVEAPAEDDEPEEAAPFTLGRTVVHGRTTLLVDVYRIVRELAPHFVRERRRPSRRGRVLVADDSNAMRAALAGYLRGIGLDVVDVPDGDAALHVLRDKSRGSFDAVITDLEMPGIDGFGLLATLRTELPHTPVFVWTYHQDPMWAERATASGARACIHKLEREQLVRELEILGIGPQRRGPEERRGH